MQLIFITHLKFRKILRIDFLISKEKGK
jgi:hypothetical protein